MRPVPDAVTHGPFSRIQALEAGVTPKMLRGRRFRRLHPRVWVLAAHDLTWDDLVAAARLALPDRVHLTGISRIQAAGLDYGPRWPVRFVIEGDHHLAIAGIFLHRTVRLPPLDDVGVSIEAAYVAYCARARVIDAIKVGDWLLHHRLMCLGRLHEVALASLWRPGAHEALWVSEHLDADARSLMESETRAVLTFAGRPRPETNREVDLAGARLALGDLVYRRWHLVVEYEGSHHQQDRTQYASDIDRYEDFRRHGVRYVQVTKERLARPQHLVRRVHRELVAAGYDGPAPHFGETWHVLFARLSVVLGSREPTASAAR